VQGSRRLRRPPGTVLKVVEKLQTSAVSLRKTTGPLRVQLPPRLSKKYNKQLIKNKKQKTMCVADVPSEFKTGSGSAYRSAFEPNCLLENFRRNSLASSESGSNSSAASSPSRTNRIPNSAGRPRPRPRPLARRYLPRPPRELPRPRPRPWLLGEGAGG
jgi:hypothetical protein